MVQKKETIAVSLDKILVKVLKEKAADQNRKVSNLVETILKRELIEDSNNAEF